MARGRPSEIESAHHPGQNNEKERNHAGAKIRQTRENARRGCVAPDEPRLGRGGQRRRPAQPTVRTPGSSEKEVQCRRRRVSQHLPEGAYCYCTKHAKGKPFCWQDLGEVCENLTACTSNAQCKSAHGRGWKCVQSCCDDLVCLPKRGSSVTALSAQAFGAGPTPTRR